MNIKNQDFYGKKVLNNYDRSEILSGKVVKINPALITLLDGRIKKGLANELQQLILDNVEKLLENKIYTFHVDINFPDYSGFGDDPPEINTMVFTPEFIDELNKFICDEGGFLNLHLLSDYPRKHLSKFNQINIGAICFQLEVIENNKALKLIIESIKGMGACVSPVLEVVGSENLVVKEKEEVYNFLKPFINKIDFLTFQVESTGSRSNNAKGMLSTERVKNYIEFMKKRFNGPFQIQGGIKIGTVKKAVELGAEFLVCGTEIFRNESNQPPQKVIDDILVEIVEVLE